MEWVIVVVLVAVGFGVLLLTFASASKIAGHLRPYVGLALIVAPIVIAMLDFTVWAIAESVVTVLFFSVYPDDQISGHGVITPIAVLIGCMSSLLMLFAFPTWIIIVFWDRFFIIAFVMLVIIPILLSGWVGIKHLWPKMRLALRVLGKNI